MEEKETKKVEKAVVETIEDQIKRLSVKLETLKEIKADLLKRLEEKEE